MDLSNKAKFGVRTTSSLLDVEDAMTSMGDQLREDGYDTRTAVVRLDSVRNEDGSYSNRITVYVDEIEETSGE